jgi:hypothetical protein
MFLSNKIDSNQNQLKGGSTLANKWSSEPELGYM